MRLGLPRTPPIVGLLALTLTACGGGSSSSGLSKLDLAAKANAACAAYQKAALAIPQPADFATNATAAASYLDKLKPLILTQFNTIKALTPNSSEKADFDKLIAAGAHQIALFDSADAKAHARDRTGLRDLQNAAVYKQNVLTPLELKLGFTTCAR